MSFSSSPALTLLLQEEVAQQSSLTGEYNLKCRYKRVPTGVLLSGALCPHSALPQPALLHLKHLSAYGCSCHIPKQPRPSNGLRALLKQPVPLQCLAGLAALPCSLCKSSQGGGGGGGGSEPVRHCLGTSWQCLPRAEDPGWEVSIVCLV